MPTIVVEVMPKAELLDPAGKAVAGALGRTGSRFAGVRIGKRFELTFEGDADAAALDEARKLADELLSNSVIEDVVSVAYADVAAPAFGDEPLSTTSVARGEFPTDAPAGPLAGSAAAGSPATGSAR